jgi:hypothetical protein
MELTRPMSRRALTSLLAGLLSLALLSPAAADAARGWNGFGAGAWPGAGWRPYADDSPFNRPVGDAPTHPRSDAIVGQVVGRWGKPATLVAGAAGTARDYAHPIYYAQPDDPTYVLRPTADWGENELDGMRIPVPPEAEPAGGDDGHMTIVTPDGWEYDLWQAQRPPRGGGTLRFSWGGRLRIDGSGVGGRATASYFGALAGVIRAEELAAGRIDHALFITVRCTSTRSDFGYGVRGPTSEGTGSAVFPAVGGGTGCRGADDQAAPPMGARFQLQMSPREIRALDVPAWKKAILTALARYGGYVGDTGGAGFGFMFESGATYTSFGRPDPFVALGRRYGLREWRGQYGFELANGVDWRRRLRIVAPPRR